MNFQQLRIIRETVRQDCNLTEVARSLHTSQSGVSKHIKELESELGVELFFRKGKRLTGMTEPAREILRYIERILVDANNIKTVSAHYSQQDSGQLTVATTHTQARYALPPVVVAFKQRYPQVHLKLHQGSPVEIAQLVLSGEADIGVATETLGKTADLVAFPYYRWYHAVIVPLQHPLTQQTQIDLASLAEYPIVTYHEGFTGRAVIEEAFREAGLSPDIVLSALDADVIKSYVTLGMGIGIVASVSVDEGRDLGLRKLDASHLFAENTSWIAVRRGQLLRDFGYRFIELCSPELSPEKVMLESNTGS